MTPDFYEKLLNTINQSLSGYVSESQAQQFAQSAALKFCLENGGEIHRIPRMKALSKKKRDEAIRMDGQDMNRRQLMAKYGVSESVIIRACK